MTTATEAAIQVRNIALIGNPNTGKTTIFNALTGFRARVGNYAGVTVERKIGAVRSSGGTVQMIDLPGTYSLSARSADEMVAVDVLLGQRPEDPRPDAVFVVVDASNLERNLFLATQVMELGLPTVLVLNMVDTAKKAEIEINEEHLAQNLGIPVVATIASKNHGLDALEDIIRSLGDIPKATRPEIFPEDFQAELLALREKLLEIGIPEPAAHPFLVRRSLLEVEGMAEKRLIEEGGEAARSAISETRQRLSDSGHRLPSLEARKRYGWIRGAIAEVVTRPDSPRTSSSDKIDGILIHKVWGTVIFAALMLIVFQAIYSWSGPLMDLVDGIFAMLGGLVASNMDPGTLQSFLVDGVIAGVGGVVIFLPQILILFLFISLLEDCGYMARAAFLMDKVLSRVGLSGRSFIPMLSSFACAVPGIMAARVIENRRDRIATILVAPLMSCSARLPVYVLLIGAFVPKRTLIPGLLGLQAVTLFAMYLVGISVAVPVALVLKRTLLRGRTPSLVMELPPYKAPHALTIFHRMIESGWSFLTNAGTIIFAVSVIIWALTYYPRPASLAEEMEAANAQQIAAVQAQIDDYLAQTNTPDSEEALLTALDSEHSPAKAGVLEEGAQLLASRQEIEDSLDRRIEGAYVRQSVLGRVGHLIEPAVKPLGWDWKIGMAAIASFLAREIIVATLGVIYDLGGDTDETTTDLRDKLRAARGPDGQPVFNIAVALSIMVFFALCMQCAATLAVIKRETNSWRWPVFTFAYMTTLAYIGSLITYQIASRLLL
ncbi:ferrous iron transport protein B [bacterium]|nr:ferrous iron transport protein B [bacterium]